MNLKTMGLWLALSLMPLAALAQATGVKVRTACAPEIQKFCAGKSKDALHQCLEANASQLSDACKTARAERAAAKSKK